MGIGMVPGHMADGVPDLSIECIDFVKPAVRAIMQSAATIEEARERVEKLVVNAYSLPVTRHRVIVVLAGESPD